jgi:GT2 family glycosyltransferase
MIDLDPLEASIIIPTRNKISRLRLVLYALSFQVNQNHEVIVVMDGNNQEDVAAFHKIDLSFKPVLIVLDQNVGRAAARNHGIRKASGKVLIFIDDDRIPGPHFIQDHVLAHQKRCCMVLGKRMQIFLAEETIGKLGDVEEFRRRMGNILFSAKRDITWLKNRIYLLPLVSPVPWLACVTSNLSVRKQDMMEVGMFDENFVGWGWEDSDLGYRFLKKKIKIVKKSQIINYHIVHSKSKNYKEEELNNYQYFYAKTQGDYITRLSLILIRVFRNTGFLLQEMMEHCQERFNG